MTKPWRLFLAGLISLLALPALAAEEARVADTAGGRVVLEFSAEPVFAVGDTVELTYQAGFMDMLMGSYAVRERQGNRLILSTLSTSNPPSQGMRVRVNRAAPLQFAPPPATSPTPASPAAQAPGEGRVVGVRGSTAEVEFPAGTAVQTGDHYTLAYEAPRVGRVNIAGTWRVKRVDGQRAQLEADGIAGLAKAGQVALPQAPMAPAATGTTPAEPGGLFPNPPPMSFEEYLRQTQPAPPPSLPPPTGAAPASIPGQSWVGLQLQGLTSELAQSLGMPAGAGGILVADVAPGSPAERAGLQPGDVILDVDGRGMAPHQLADRVRQSPPDTLIRMRILRDGGKMFVVVRTAAKP